MTHRHALLPLFALMPLHLAAGPYAPAAGQGGSTAVPMDSPAIVAWASGVANYSPGSNVEEYWRVPSNALGPAEGLSDDGLVVLGRGGSITLTFNQPISDGPGFDFAIFENGFMNGSGAAAYFLELAWVEVSSDGTNFVRFPNNSLTSGPVGGFASVDPTNIDGLAGKYERGYGTPFDLANVSGVDTSAITHVRIIDIVGDGSARDSANRVIYDPFPTLLSAGFDLDAVAVLNALAAPEVTASVSGNQLTLTWQGVAGRSHIVQSSSNGTSWATVATLPGTAGTMQHTMAVPSQGVLLRVLVQ